MTGITPHPILSLGSFKLGIREQNSILEHKFHLVPREFQIPAFGIIGKDFLERFHCLIDFGEKSFTIRPKGLEPIRLEIESEMLPGVAAIPARAETFKLFHIKSEKFPCIIEAQEIRDTIAIPTTVAHQPETWIRVLSVDEDIKMIETDNLKTSPLEDFTVYKPEEQESTDDTRLNKLKNILQTKVPGFARKRLIDLCKTYSDVFHIEGDKFTTNNFYTQKINMSDNSPVFSRNYRQPYVHKEEINKQVKILLENDLIELSTSSFNSPIIIVPKKSSDGKPKYRMCIDYRKLNKQIVPDKFPLPRIEEIFEGLGRAQYFSIMDLHSGFHQIPIEKDSRHVTSFSTENGFYQWKVLPFGINIAPASFSRMMTIAFSGLPPDQAFIYMDDLIVIGFSENQHINNLENVFKVCRKTNLKLNPEKCEFFKREIIFLGHNCTADGLKPDPKKIEAVKKYPTPNDKDAVKRFVAFANYYRRFIANFSTITHPLTHLLKKRIEFKWTNECQLAFDTIKECLTSTPTLAYPDFKKQFRVTVDASNLGCGAVLSQIDDEGNDRPISFISRTFKKGELNKAIIEKELLAIHFALKSFRHYLYGQNFTVFSDHKPLIYLFKLKNPSSKLMRIKMDLEEFDFSIEYIKGPENVVADALSRISIKDLHNIYEDNHIFKIDVKSVKSKSQKSQKSKIRGTYPILAYTRAQAASAKQIADIHDKSNGSSLSIDTSNVKAVENCPFNKKLTPKIRTTNVLSRKGSLRKVEFKIYHRRQQLATIELNQDNEILTLGRIFSHIENLVNAHNFEQLEWPLYDKIFEFCTLNDFKTTANNVLKTLQVVLTKKPIRITNSQQKADLISKYHTDELYGGHCGQKKLYAKLRANFYWRNMAKDVSKFVRNCETCKLSNPNPKTKTPLLLTKTPCKPFDIIQIDTIGPLPKSNNDNVYAVTLIDEMTKWLNIIRLKTKTSLEIAHAIVTNHILLFGPMKQIKSDRGTEFVSALITELCKILNIEHSVSTSYHHETVGQIERNHRTLNEYLRKYLNGKMDNWDIYAKMFQFLYNISKNSTFNDKYSPFELVYLRESNMPHDILNGQVDKNYNIDNYAKETKIRLQLIHRETVELINKMKERNKKYFDKNVKQLELQAGDIVKLHKEPYEKFKHIYDGPFVIEKVDHSNAVIKSDGGKLITVHKNRLVKY